MPVDGPRLLDMVSDQVASLTVSHIFRRDYPDYTRCTNGVLLTSKLYVEVSERASLEF